MSNPLSMSSNALSDDGFTDTKSFADILKDRNDDSDKDSQTANAPGPLTSPKRAAVHERKPQRKIDAAPLSLTGEAAAQPQVLDSRSLRLSLPAAGGAGKAAGAAAAAPLAQSSAAGTSKAPVAFGVSLAKPAGAPPNAVSAEAGAQHSKDSKDRDDAPDTPAAPVASAAVKDTTQTAVATAALASMNSAPPPIATAAYTPPPSFTSTAPVAAAAPVAPVLDPPVTPSVRSNSIDIQVPGSAGDQVDVRVSQRAGDVQVTVRTPDSELAESLRQHLPELSDRLSQTGVTGEVWQPAAAAEMPAGFSNSHDESSGNWQGQPQQHQDQPQPQADPDSQQNQRGNRWINHFYNAEQESR